jgi:peptide deformylase
LEARAGHVEQLSMGSLMVGWDKDPWSEQRELTRSRTSLTKEEIEDFWRKRQLDMEEHLKAAKAQGVGTPSIDIPKAIIIEELDELPESMSPDWWTRSNSAFLNSPPENMGKRSKYTAQYEVAKRATQAT